MNITMYVIVVIAMLGFFLNLKVEHTDKEKPLIVAALLSWPPLFVATVAAYSAYFPVGMFAQITIIVGILASLIASFDPIWANRVLEKHLIKIVFFFSIAAIILSFVVELVWKDRPGDYVLCFCGGGLYISGFYLVGMRRWHEQAALAKNGAFSGP